MKGLLSNYGAVVVLLTVALLGAPCTASLMKAQLRGDSSAATDRARSVLKSFKEEDSKLRTAYRELLLEYDRCKSTIAARDRAFANANNPGLLRDIRAQNRVDYRRLDKEAKGLETKMRASEKNFKKQQDRLLERLNKQAVPAIRQLGQSAGSAAISDIKDFLDLFVFDSKHEVVCLRR